MSLRIINFTFNNAYIPIFKKEAENIVQTTTQLDYFKFAGKHYIYPYTNNKFYIHRTWEFKLLFLIVFVCNKEHTLTKEYAHQRISEVINVHFSEQLTENPLRQFIIINREYNTYFVISYPCYGGAR